MKPLQGALKGCTGDLSSRLQQLLPTATGTEAMAVVPKGLSGYPREVMSKESNGHCVHRMSQLQEPSIPC